MGKFKLIMQLSLKTTIGLGEFGKFILVQGNKIQQNYKNVVLVQAKGSRAPVANPKMP